MSMAKAIRFYTQRGCLNLKGSEETAKFVEYWNNIFDQFNRTLPWQGLKINDEGFQVKNTYCVNYF